MTATAIINNIQQLPIAEQYFIVEKLMHLLRIEQTEEKNSTFVREQVLVLPNWQKEILAQRLEDVKNGDVVSEEEANKIFEQCLA